MNEYVNRIANKFFYSGMVAGFGISVLVYLSLDILGVIK